MRNGAKSGTPGASGRGFTLVELLTTILIIALIVAILLPALGGARTSARKAATRAMLTDLSQACTVYQKDKRVQPGYFTPREMADTGNQTRKFTAMQNIMLDLAGGIAKPGASGTNIKDVGPIASRTVKVDVEMIGTSSAGESPYYKPDPKVWAMLDGSANGSMQTDQQSHREMRQMVDPFGTPVLAWVKDPTAVQRVASVDDFAAMWAPAAANTAPARYYWGPNSAFLWTGVQVGKRLVDQGTKSVLGYSYSSTRKFSMAGLLGNVASPGNLNGAAQPEDVVPSDGLGAIVFHSAGADGTYLSRDDAGAKRCIQSAEGPVLYYGLNFLIKGATAPNNRVDPKAARPLDLFDDVIVATE